jgi:hypothetical protein
MSIVSNINNCRLLLVPESHAKAEQTARAGNVRDATHLLCLSKSLRVRLFDEDVDDGKVLAGVVVDLVLDLAAHVPAGTKFEHRIRMVDLLLLKSKTFLMYTIKE